MTGVHAMRPAECATPFVLSPDFDEIPPMNPELLLALDLGFGMGVYSVLHVLAMWGGLYLLGQGGDVGKVAIMTGSSEKPLILRKVGDVWLQLGYMPGTYLQRRDAVADLVDTLPLDEAEGPAKEPVQALEGGPLRSAYQARDAEARGSLTDMAATEDKAVEAFAVPTQWHWLSLGLSLLICAVLLGVAAAGAGGQVWTGFGGHLGEVLLRVFYLSDRSPDLGAVVAGAPGYAALAYSMVWLIAATLVSKVGELVGTLMPRRLRGRSTWLGLLFALFLMVRTCMIAAELVDSFWGALAMYLLGGFAMHFVLYWVLVGGLRAVLGRQGN
jgi:hypothetical protein